MPMFLAELIVGLAQAYGLIGLLVALPFAARAVDRIDPQARGAPWAFRVLIVPGTAIFWPLLLLRWAAGSVAPPVEVNAHRRTARRTS
jgi:hypothetical protein